MDLAVAAFIVGAFGLLVAGVSLGWQIVSFLLSGGRVKVDIQRLTLFSGPGMHEPIVSVTARNVGRQAVSVTSCWLEFEQGAACSTFALSPSIRPYRPRSSPDTT